MPKEYRVEFPDYFADYAGEIEAKGYFADLLITIGPRQIRPVIYDPTRLDQECRDALSSDSYFAKSALIVVAAVTKHNIEAALERLAASNFSELLGS